MNKIVKNASWIIICRIIQSLLGFVVSMMTARYLGPSNYGLINYAQSLVVFVTPLMLLGFNNILVQEIVNSPEIEGLTIGTAVFFSFISSLLCSIGVIGFAIVANAGQRETIIVCALFSINLVAQAFEQIEYWFQAKLLSKYRAIIGLIAYTIVSAYKIYLLATGKNVYWFAVSYAIDYTIISIALFVYYKKLGGGRLEISTKAARRMLKRSSPYILSSMMITIFTQTDKIMLNQMMDSSATGYYSAAVLLAGITSFVFQAVIDSFRPKLFEDLKLSSAKFEKGLVELYSIVIYASLLQCVAMSAFAGIIVKLTYGSQYHVAINALRIVVWYSTFSYLGVIRNIWILAENKQKYLTPINLFGAIANVILNFALIPVLGINGAALASFLTQFFTNVITGFIIKPIRYNNTIMFKALNPKIAIHTVDVVLKEVLKCKNKA